jgi:hypothetical protein
MARLREIDFMAPFREGPIAYKPACALQAISVPQDNRPSIELPELSPPLEDVV